MASKPHILCVRAAFCIDNKIFLVQKSIRHFNSLIQQPTRIVPEIQDQFWYFLFLKFIQGFIQIQTGIFWKTADFDITNVFFIKFMDNTPDFNNGPDNGKFFRDFERIPENGDGNRRTGFPPKPGDRILKCHIKGWLLFNFDNFIARFNSHLKSWSFFNRWNNGKDTIPNTDFNAQSAKFSSCLHLHFFIWCRGQIGGMGIEGLDHSPYGPINNGVTFNRFHIIRFNQRKYLGEYL